MIKTFISAYIGACCCLGPTQVRAEDCIGFVPSGGGGVFWRSVQSGAVEAGKAYGYDIYFRGPQEEDQPVAQSTVLALIRERGCKAVVIAPGAAQVETTVTELQRTGVPVIYVDRALAGHAASGMIGTDNYKAGQLAGEAMARSLNGKGTVLLFRMKRGWSSTGQREKGFAEAAARKGLAVIEGGYIGSVNGEAYVLGSRGLLRHKGKFQGVFAPNEATSMGVLAALRQQRLAGAVKYIGVDVTDQLLEGLQSGVVEGLVMQSPQVIGYQAVQMAAEAIAGKRPARRHVLVDAVYLSKSNIDAYFP